MSIEEANVVAHQLKELLCGYNYEVSLGFNVYQNCSTMDHFKQRLKLTYPETRPNDVTPTESTLTNFYECLNEGFDYRGDEVSGLRLNDQQEALLEELKGKYKDFLFSFFSPTSVVYQYPYDQGIPYYPVYWDYAFIIQCDNEVFLFVYGAASD